ncbi:MAG: T9SS type A sorting domain-containing protein [Ignavibacteriae bacterium]|nr:T9SS type A sorting domain-containing protein [Ignavibacteriota bacterium]
MKKLLLLTLLLVLPVFGFSQTAEEIRKEAYPDLVNVTDNSEYAKLLGRLTDAKKSGNLTGFNALLSELNTKYLDKGSLTSGKQLPAVRDYFVPTMTQPEESNFTPDWANGENRIYPGNVSPATTGNPNFFNRHVKIETDTMGVLFTAFINGTKDSLIFYRSTNQGAAWTKIQSIWSGAGLIYYSFDFAVTDTTGGFKIGMAVSIAPSATPYAGIIYYANLLPDGSGLSPSTLYTPIAGRGFIGPVICSDGYSWTPGTTYWYIACQSVDAVTGLTSYVPAAYTPDWGNTWVQDTVRSTYNDYELDIDYNFDSVYVILTNNLITSNQNLRLRYTALSNFGTIATDWRQFNPANTTNHEYNPCLAVNRKTNAMVVTFTTDSTAIIRIKYSYAANGISWTINNLLSGQSNNESRSYISGSNQQSGAFRVVWVSSGAAFDSVFYMSTTNVASGFVGKTSVSRVNQSTGVLAPCVTGYMFNGTSPGGGVVYAGQGPANIWYNGSSLLTGINPVSGTIPGRYSLSQNYPNPFNPVTKINFSIPNNNLVTIKIYNSLGKEVAVLVNGTYSAGEYEVTLNGASLSSGVYFYKITAGDFSETKKMLLTK